MKQRKLPIGIQTFSDIVKGGYVYADKTDLVYKMASDGKAYFLSRPRRFGKSLLVSTFDAYFNGRKELFTGLAMEALEKEWKKYPVFRFDLSGTDYSTEDSLSEALDTILGEYEAKYLKKGPFGIFKIPKKKMLSLRFAALLQIAHKKTGLQCVVLVDEYDKPLLDTDNNEELNMKHRQLFKAFFGNIKKCDEHLRFAFFTGIMKFSGVSIFSDLNNLNIISLDRAYSAICGITQAELESNFRPEIEEMAKSNNITYDECLAHLKAMYDGYHFTADLTDVYNPFGLLKALSQKDFGYYWYEGATPAILLERLKRNNWDIIDYAEGVPSDMATLGNTEINKNDITPLLYQSGYLTIKSYNADSGTFYLCYPNKEVRTGFIKAIVPRYLTNQESIQALDVIQFKNDLAAGDLPALFTRLKAVYAGIPYAEGVDPERFLERDFRNAAHIVFTLLGGITQCEAHFSRGRSDCIVQMPQCVYVFEFKRDKSADEAIAQIDEKGYAAPFASDSRKVLKVGVSFSSKLRNIDEWKAVKG